MQSLENIDLMQQGRVLDDQHIRCEYRFAQSDLAAINAAESDYRGTGALRTETGKCHCMTALLECGNRQHLGRCHYTLTTPAVKPHLKPGARSSCWIAPVLLAGSFLCFDLNQGERSSPKMLRRLIRQDGISRL